MTIAQVISAENACCGFLVMFIFETGLLVVRHDF